VRWNRGGSCAPSVAVCGSLRQWDIRYEEPSGTAVLAVDRSSRPLDRLRSHPGADFSYPLWPSSQPHSARPSTRLAEIWSSLAVAAGVLAVAISTPPFGLAPILQDLPHDFSSNRGIYPSRWTRGSRCEGASAAVLADLQCIIACPWAPCTPHSPKSSIAGAI
jgi:hypothetical protein